MAATDHRTGSDVGERPSETVAFHDAVTAAAPTGLVSAVIAAAGPASEAAASPPSQPFNCGDRIGEGGRFEIAEKLGAGGMGHVYRAIDWHLDRTVAIKLILETGKMPLEQLVGLLKREAKATAKLNHENIVAIFDMDAFQGVPFLVMELLDGQSLDALMERSRLTPLRATQIMIHVARGLAHAHGNGIIHRDLKPSNVFILRDGRAKILDFGISRLERPLVAPAVSPSDVGPTVSGVGTPAYMAPEQWRGEAQDARTDIWAAGVMFHQMLTRRLPFSVQELIVRYAMRGATERMLAPSVRQLAPELPPEAETIIATALNEDPAGRFPSARELLLALRELERALAGGAADGEAAGRVVPQVERRPLTIVACSLEGVGDLDLDDLVEIDQRFYRAAADATKREGGTIGTPVGGKVLCCFGHPAVKEDDAQRAVRVALSIAEAMREEAAGPRLDFKIGVHSGVVGLPAIGAAQGLPAMTGDLPNVASRVADAAAPNTVLMSQATLELTGGLFLTQPQGALVRGAARLHRVDGEAETESRFDQAFAAALTPFVGREGELGRLYQLWEQAKDGHGHVIVVTGEPGIGKSRLVQTLRERVDAEQNTRLTCQCWPHFKNSALHPIIQLLLRSMGIEREDGPAARLAKLEQTLGTLGFTPSEAVPLFASLLSIPLPEGGPYPALALSPEQQKLKTLDALASMLLRTALLRPTLFIIEDMHWVDHSTIEFLNALVDLARTSRILVVLTARPEFRVPWSARPHLHELPLDRLSAAVTAAMIERASRERRLPPEMTDRLIATTDGVPLFVEELTRMVVESWETAQTGPRMAIPGTLHELLLARLDRLRGVGKEVAQIGSILGRDFEYALIRDVAPLDELSLEEGLEILAEADVLHPEGRPPDSRYVFKHALIQQAAYQSLVKAERQRHHRRTAEVLATNFRETAAEAPELLAHHHSEAGDTAEAVTYWEKAGRRATQRSALVEAIDHYTRAREALRGLPEGPARDKKELELLLAVGSPLMSVHGYATPEVERTYARARELARAVGGQAEIFPAMAGLWQFYYVRGLLPTSRKLGHELLDIAHEAHDSTFLLLAHRSIASSAFLQGDFATCREHTEEGFRLYDMKAHGALALRMGHDPGVAHGVYLAWALWMLGYADQSLDRVMEMIELAKTLDHPMTTAYALCFAALVQNHRGEHPAARELSEAALEITVPNKFALWTAWGRMQRGWAMARTGDLEGGIPEMREGLLGWKNTGARVGFTMFPVTLAEICLHAGRLDDTQALLDEAAPMVGENDEHFYEPEMRRLMGELCLRRGGEGAFDEAARHYQHGIDVARRLAGKSWERRLLMSRARLLADRGESARALEEMRTVEAWFTEGHGTADARAARAQIAALAGEGVVSAGHRV